MNRRSERFNLFTQLGVGHRTFPNTFETLNHNLLSGTKVENGGTGDKNETFYNVILGTDYHLAPNHVITLSGSFAYEIETEFSSGQFGVLNSDRIYDSRWTRNEDTEATNPKYQYDFQYKGEFNGNEDHMLLFSATGRFFGKDQHSTYANVSNLGLPPSLDQMVQTDFLNANHTFKLDYTNPISEVLMLEAGAEYLLSNVGNDYQVDELIDGIWTTNLNLTNDFNYDQDVLASYVTGAYEGNKWGVKAGLRLEHTDLDILLATTGRTAFQRYTNLFPSFHTSYKVTEAISFQAGYSRRIFRPRMWDLNPFFNIRNNFNVRTGNPDLLPEFSDAYELNGIFVGDKTSFNLGFYHRYTTDVIERVSTFEENVSTTIPLNVGTERTSGIEFNGKYNPSRKLTFTGDFNFNFFDRAGVFQETDFGFSGNQWSSRLRTKVKLPAEFEVEITGNYRSRLKGLQAVYSANAHLDLGVRKKLMNGKTIVNLSVRDVFSSRFRESETFQDQFYVYSYSQRGRFISLGISYGFGKGEAMEFSAQKRH